VAVLPIDDIAPGQVTVIWDAAVADPVREAFVAAAVASAAQTV
jgi:hypothetical protein